jgi:arginine-tRNA-protein transferase
MDTEAYGLREAMQTIAETSPRRFYATRQAPCPYLPGRQERKVFTELGGPDADELHDVLAVNGFRRSQGICYRPLCDGCSACVAVRVRAPELKPSRWMKRVLSRNADLVMTRNPSQATVEQFDLFSIYLNARHADGGMADMTFDEYRSMVEDTEVTTEVIEFRNAGGELAAACLIDVLADGLSLIYSFFDPGRERLSTGSDIILRLIHRAASEGKGYVYLGYWIENSRTMAYKIRFSPIEMLGPDGWQLLDTGEVGGAADASPPG